MSTSLVNNAALQILYGIEKWCVRENEMAILRSTERVMVRAISGAKLMEKKRTDDLMEMLGLKETMVPMGKANGERWYGHVLRREKGYLERRGICKWRMEGKSVGLKNEDAINRAR